MRVLLTGAAGFLGWHTRARLHALTEHEVIPVTRENWLALPDLARDADAILHLAGVNRGEPTEVEQGNVGLAQDLVRALSTAGFPPVLVYANSIAASADNPYGRGKSGAARMLGAASTAAGARFVDIELPNLFGEHGRPHYNSFVATFVDCVLRGAEPLISDRPVALLHVQAAAAQLIDALTADDAAAPATTEVSVAGVYHQLREFDRLYVSGDLPVLDSAFAVDLFNTYRAACFPARYPLTLTKRSDDRGTLVEVVRAHGGQGQTFASSTRSGITRGEHFHLRKIERFVVVSGRATISLRRLFDDAVVSFEVSGDEPALVDMPTMWAHNITNTGDEDLLTLFWTHELFDSDRPDTYPEKVALAC